VPLEPTVPSRGTNRRGAKTRASLVEAAWRLVDSMDLTETLAGLTPSRVAEAAGVTAGAFHHHFDTHEDLVAAMVDALFAELLGDDGVGVLPGPGHELAGSVDGEAGPSVSESGLPSDLARVAARAAWARSSSATGLQFLVRGLLVQNRASVTRLVDGRELSEVVDERYWQRFFEASVRLYDAAFEAAGRRPIDPFTTTDFARVFSAVQLGFFIQDGAVPNPRSGELYADVVASVVSGWTTPTESHGAVVDLELELLGTPGDGGELDVLRDVATTAAPLFAGGWEAVRWSAVGAAVGRSPVAVARMFGTTRRVAAVGFAGCADEVIAAAARYRDRDPHRALVDALCVIARAAVASPNLALAFLGERLRSRVGSRRPVDRFDVASAVAIDAPLVDLVESVAIRPSESDVTVALLIDTVLMLGSTRTNLAPWEMADHAIQLVSKSLIGREGHRMGGPSDV